MEKSDMGRKRKEMEVNEKRTFRDWCIEFGCNDSLKKKKSSLMESLLSLEEYNHIVGEDVEDEEVGDEEIGDEEGDEEIEDEEVEGEFELYAKIESHSNCNNCKYKLMGAFADPKAELVEYSIESNEYVTAIGIGKLDEKDLAKFLEERLGKKIKLSIVEQVCEPEDEGPKHRFDIGKFSKFFKSYGANVGKTSEGRWGRLYGETYGGVMKIIMEETASEGVVDKHYGTGFVIHKDDTRCILLSCGHTFEEWNEEFKVHVVSSEFKSFEARLVYKCPNMDFSVLQVNGNVGENVKRLECLMRDLNFGEEICSISTPSYTMCVPDHIKAMKKWEKKVDTLWFPLSRGTVSHPWGVGLHPKNDAGELMVLHIGGMGEGASGAPIMDKSGSVVGLYISTVSLDEDTKVQMALKLTSILDFLISQFHLPKEKKLLPLRKIIRHLAKKEWHTWNT